MSKRYNLECPKCKNDMLRHRIRGEESFLHCWSCHRNFTKDLGRELKGSEYD